MTKSHPNCKRFSFSLSLACLLSPWILAGCVVSAPGYGGSGTFLAGSITPKSAWRAVGDLAQPAAAIDERRGTAAVGQADFAGQTLLIDLQKACLFQTVFMEHGGDGLGFAPVVEVATSLDARNFRIRYVVPGTRTVTIASLGEPVLARYLRLRATRAGPRPWSLAEVHLQ